VRKVFVRTTKEFQDAIEDIENNSIIAVDTETSGLDPYTSELWSVQIGTKNNAYLFPFTFLSYNQKELLGKITSNKLVVAHNAKFDAKMLKVNNFSIDYVWCTQEAEKVLYAGKYFRFGLKDLLKRYFKIEIDKEIRDDFWNGVFAESIASYGIDAWSEEYIEYAITDIEYLIPIYEKQKLQGEKQGISSLLETEASLVIALSNMELRGVWLDKEALKKFRSKVLLRKDELELEATQQLEKFYKARAQKEYARRLKIWDEWKLRHEKIKIDSYERDPNDARKKSGKAKQAVEDSNKLKPYSSPPQLDDVFNLASALKLRMALCEALGFELTTTSKEWLEDNIALHTVIATLVEYRKFKKLAEFCEIDEKLNQHTGKIHCEYRQNGTVSGRMSCVPMTTTALTRDGWKSYDELVLGEEILAYDMESRIQVWTPLLSKAKYSNVPVGSFGLDTRRFRCTDNHRWVIVKGHTQDSCQSYIPKESLVEAKDIKYGHRVVMNAPYTNGAYSSIDFNVFSTEKYATDYSKLITRMSKQQVDTFVLGFLLADGHNTSPTKIGSKKGWQWTQARTVTREHALLATYLQHNGRIGVGKHYNGENKLEHNVSDRVTLCHSPYTAVNKIWEYENHEDVWCPTTKFGTWIMRQGDLITITGNSVNPNLQQIPARTNEAKEFRALFKAQEGMKFVDADFAGIELVIIAHDSNENVLLDAINSDKDIHCFTMSKFLNCDYETLVSLKKGEDISSKQLDDFQLARDRFEANFYLSELVSKTRDTDWVKTFRDYVKTITYGLAYGLSSYGLSKKFHCDYKVAEQFIERFFTVYPNIKKLLDKLEDKGIRQLYAINPAGRRRYFSMPKRKSLQEIEKEVINTLEKKEKRLWDSVTEKEWSALMQEAVVASEKEYKGKINGIKRQAANFYPQSISAEMIKDATVEFDKQWLEYKNGDSSSGLLLSIHDELLGEFYDEDVAEASKMLSKIMEEAGKKFLPKVKLVVEAKVSDVWEK